MSSIIKRKCDKCGKVANHIINSGSHVSWDVFNNCIYIKGKLRWAGSFIGRAGYIENLVICSECGSEYKYTGKKWFRARVRAETDIIEYLQSKNHLFPNDEDREILEDHGVKCSQYTSNIIKTNGGVDFI